MPLFTTHVALSGGIVSTTRGETVKWGWGEWFIFIMLLLAVVSGSTFVIALVIGVHK